MSEPATGVSDRRRTVESALARVLEWDLDSYLELFEKDAITESPFAPAGFPGRMEGAASIRVQLASLWKRAQESGRRFVGYDPLNIYEGSDSGVVVAEFQARRVRCSGQETRHIRPQLRPHLYLVGGRQDTVAARLLEPSRNCIVAGSGYLTLPNVTESAKTSHW